MWREQVGARRLRRGQGGCGLSRLLSGERTLFYAPIGHDVGAARLPICLRVLLENLTRQACLGADVSSQIEALLGRVSGARLGIFPARVLLDDRVGLPLLIDLVSLRDAVATAGGDSTAVNPRLQVDLLMSANAVEADSSAQREQTEFLAWCRRNVDNLRVLPAGAREAQWLNVLGLSEVVRTESAGGAVLASPDSLIGTHGHTTAANGAGVLGWCVGGLDATATLLGKPLSLIVPQVVGVELRGWPPAQVDPREFARRVSEALPRPGIAGKLVEFFGPGVEALSVPIRTLLASMAPETGATCLYFPVDRRTLDYMRSTGYELERVRLLEQYAKVQRLWADRAAEPPDYETVVGLDLEAIGRPVVHSLHASACFNPKVAHLTAGPFCHSRLERAGSVSPSDYSHAVAHGGRFQWPRPGNWISRAPFFDGLTLAASPLDDIVAARPLVIVGDAVAVDVISPSGEIAPGSAAEEYLRTAGHSRGARDTYEMLRCNYEVAVRGTFASSSLQNRLTPGAGGGLTTLMPDRVPMRVFDAASEYQRRNVPLVVIAGRRYGCGTAHDWAAKGVAALGVRAVIAASFEPIHRASLIGAGVLPLVFFERCEPAIRALDGSQTLDLIDLDWSVGVRTQVECIIRDSAGASTRVLLRTAIETADELYYLRNGGILPALWREQTRGFHVTV